MRDAGGGVAVGPNDCLAIAFRADSPELFTTPNAVQGANPAIIGQAAYLRVLASPIGL